MADEQEPLAIDAERMRKLGQTLRSRFSAYEKARSSAEEQWLKNVRQFVGEYDPKILAVLEPEQSRAYPRITRVKVLALVARLHALLFPAGEKNWGVESSPQPILPAQKLTDILGKWMAGNPQAVATQEDIDQLVKIAAGDIAKRMEEIVNDQLSDAQADGTGDYQKLVRDVIFSGTLYGCGVLKGPMTIAQTGAMIVVDDQGFPRVVEAPMYRPYYEFVSLWDYYPDFSAKTFNQMDGSFQRHVYSKHSLTRLADREDFIGDAILRYVREKSDGNYSKKNYETQLNSISDENRQSQPGEGSKYELIEYWGCVSGEDLRGAGVEVPDSDLTKDAYANVWMVDDVIIKVAQHPYPEGVSMYHQFVFEEDEVNLLGSGLPAIMRDSQLGVSSFTRMLVDNASAVCGPNLEVDLDQLSASVNPNTVRPFKVWAKDSANANGSRAVQNVSFDAHIGELLQAIKLMREFADTETFINPMTGGDFENAPSEALRTQGNMSMAMASAALPFKDIVRNFDQFTKSVIHALVQWNLVYHPRRAELQGDLRPIPRGASSLMAKEVRGVALDNLANTLSDSDRLYINEEELLKERLQVRDLPLDRLMLPKAEVEQRKTQQAEQASRAQEQQDQLFEAQLRNQNTDSLKNVAQSQKNMDSGDVIVFKALMEAIKMGADIDELQRIAGGSGRRPEEIAGGERSGARTTAGLPAG